MQHFVFSSVNVNIAARICSTWRYEVVQADRQKTVCSSEKCVSSACQVVIWVMRHLFRVKDRW